VFFLLTGNIRSTSGVVFPFKSFTILFT